MPGTPFWMVRSISVGAFLAHERVVQGGGQFARPVRAMAGHALGGKDGDALRQFSPRAAVYLLQDLRIGLGGERHLRRHAQVDYPVLHLLPVALLDQQHHLLDLVIAQRAAVFLAPGGHGGVIAAGRSPWPGQRIAVAQVGVIQRQGGADTLAFQPVADGAVLGIQVMPGPGRLRPGPAAPGRSAPVLKSIEEQPYS